MCNFQPKLENFRITKTTLQTVDRSGLGNLTNLRHLMLDRNKIDWIFPDAFRDLPNLESVFLSNNKIEFLHSNLLSENTKLRSFWADYNRIERLEAGTFAKNTKIEWISLSHNQIKKIEFKFGQITSLLHVNLEKNFKNCNLKFNKEAESLEEFDARANELCNLY